MTYDEITLWRKFMQSKGVLNDFEYLYDSHKFDKRTLDDYLADVQAEDVILSAFDFSRAGNTIFGFKYWKDMNVKWQEKLSEFRETGTSDLPGATVLCQHCGRKLPVYYFAYSSKGVLHKHCKECESGQWDREMKKQKLLEREQAEIESLDREIAERVANLDKTTKVCDHCGKRKLKSEFAANPSSPDGLDSWCKKCQSAAVNVTAEADNRHEREEAKKAVVESVAQPAPTEAEPAKQAPVKPDRLTAPKLGEYDATLHFKKGQKSITLNAELSRQIREGEYTKCYLNPDRQMRQFLIFNRVEGANITGASSIAQNLLNVNSADIVRALAARFGLEEGDNYYLHITKNLAPKADVITVQVLTARTREEYTRLAEKREEAKKKGVELPGEDIPEYEAYKEPEPEPVTDVPATEAQAPAVVDVPMVEFADITDTLAGLSSPQEVIQKVIDKGLVTEHDIAAFLFNKGWELHEPVVVTRHKKFSI